MTATGLVTVIDTRRLSPAARSKKLSLERAVGASTYIYLPMGVVIVLSAPNHPEHEIILRERFGVADVLAGHGMTEINIALYGRLGDARPGACGRPCDTFFEVKIRDPQTDFPVAQGEATHDQSCCSPGLRNRS